MGNSIELLVSIGFPVSSLNKFNATLILATESTLMFVFTENLNGTEVSCFDSIDSLL